MIVIRGAYKRRKGAYIQDFRVSPELDRICNFAPTEMKPARGRSIKLRKLMKINL